VGLRLEHVSRAWAGFALRDISLDVADGEYFALLGPNGAGKTLLLETVLGFHKVDEGRILLEDVDVTSMPPEKRSMGYVSQTCVLFPHMKVRQNVEFGLKMRGMSEVERERTVDNVLSLMGIANLADRSPLRLSGGETQKVALARVLAIKPKVILLDEPLASIDTESSRVMREELKRVHRDLKVSVIHVTHNQMEAFSLAQRIAIMNCGQILQVDTAESLLSRPNDEFVARFLGYENIFKGRLVQRDSGLMSVDVGSFVIKVRGEAYGAECVIGIRPEDISLSLKPPASSESNVIRGVVTDCIDVGPMVSVSIDAGLRLKAVVVKGSFLELNLDRGMKIWVSLKYELVKLFGKRQAISALDSVV
jgi:molybdate/tungstate transport system ATP-binding protein